MPSWVFFALGSAVFAGLTTVLAKVGVRDVPSNLATLIRIAALTPPLILIISIRREWVSFSALPGRTVLFLVLSGLATGASWLCYFRALQMGPASVVAPIDKLSLAVAIGLSVLFLGEHLDTRQWIGAFLTIAGTFLLIRS